MANKITTIIDFVTDSAQRSVKTFRQSVAEAEGATGKFKAGASSAMTTVQANAGALAVAGGAALVAFGAKAVASFQSTALEAGKFSDATGLAVEDASRWLEVAGDMGVEAGTVEGLFVRMNKAIATGGPAVEEYGLSLERAADGTADVNATMLAAIQRISDIEDPTKRAQAAQEIFGRSYKEAAELIFNSADGVKQKLDEVSDAKVINDDELRKAREFRDSMEDLKDASQDLATITGQTLVPVLGDLADFLVTVKERAGDAKDAIEDIPGGGSLLDALGTNIFELPKKSKQEWDELGRKIGIIPDKVAEIGSKRAEFEAIIAAGNASKDAIGGLGDEADEAAEEVADLGDKAANSGPKIGDMAGALDDAEQHLADLNQEAKDNALDEFAEAIQGVRDAIDDAFGDLEGDLDELDAFDDIKEQFEKIAEAQKNGEAGTRDFNREVRDLQRQLLDLVSVRDDLSANEKIEFATRIRQGDIETLNRVLDDLTKDRWINVGVRGNPQQAFSSIGGTFSPTQAAPVINGSNPAPSGGTVDNRTINVFYPVGSTPTTQYIDSQTDYRRNGIR